MSAERVLIVDDDSIPAAHLSLLLTSLGYEVVGTLTSAEETIQRIAGLQPDVVLMDISLSGSLTGIEAAEWIGQRYDIPIVYLTASCEAEVMERARLTHPSGYLLKPIRDYEIRNCLEMACYKHKTERKLKHLNAVLHAVRDIGQITVHESDPNRLLRQACQTLVSIQGYLLAWVAHWNEIENQVDVSASAGPEQFQKTLGRVLHSIGGQKPSLFESAVQERRSVVCNDLGREYDWAFHQRTLAQIGCIAAVAAPILKEDLLQGVLMVVASPGQPFEEDETNLLAELASDLGFALWSRSQEQQRLHTEKLLRQRLQELETVNRLSINLRAAHTLDEMLPLLLQEILQAIATPCGAIYLKNKDDLLSQAVGAGWLLHYRQVTLKSDAGIVGHAIQLGRPYISEEIASDPYLLPANRPGVPGGWSSICLPVRSPGGLLGALLVAVQSPRRISQDEVRLLSTIAEITGTAIQRTLLREDLKSTNLELRREVDQRQVMQDLLAQEKELLTVTLLSIADGVIVTDQDGEITLLNLSAEKITGYAAAEALGRPLDQVFQILEAHSGLSVGNSLHYLLGLKESSESAGDPPLLLTRTGHRVLLAVNLSPIRTASTALLGYVIVFDNITERQRLEAQSALSQKMESIGRLATGIAHEINTPIQYVGDNLNFLQRGFQQMAEMEQAYLRLIHTGQQRLIQEEDIQALNELLAHKKISHYTGEAPLAIQEALEGIERVRKIVLAIREFSHPSAREKKMADINHGIVHESIVKYDTDVFCNLPERV